MSPLCRGYYFLVNQSLNKMFSAFARFGVASSEVNQVDKCFSGGLVVTGALPFREGDALGIGFAQAENGKEFRTNMAKTSIKVDRAETVYELFYNIALPRGVSLQPDFQYVQNPGMDPALGDARVGILRLTAAL